MKINNLSGLRQETERLEYKLKVDKSKLKTEFQLLRFQIVGYAFKEIIGLFRKPKDNVDSDTGKKNSTSEE